ncbi:MAG TPA: class I SAM-dependent methyltransferase [Alphaproteobacteria bacterium]|jgi:demethylmenaquinone methyltransferase/2-methoxy-6-polyprenyl-1,4-benzoquinol methylase|nr:class I SAM-dependent methyltransferase [Alphaproteobacteria bacterium]MDP6269634.1 class I SAM-dependent methyltransferase [Alphaproteobacteria bacterium]MDP7428329.1 class I SAM-dependent methyltransferase [Alphaproteobacteria bacterium]HJM50317.1 class I SAM-dependent methyltransferase [Alphaproteobacteria bacterium]
MTEQPAAHPAKPAQPDKRQRVRALFDDVAERYDLMNTVLGGGVHHLWASSMMDWLAPRPGMRLLDVAGGTGDIANRFLKRLGGTGTAVVCDINQRMLEVGRDRAFNRNQVRGLSWLCGNAEALPIADGFADAYTIAYGLRNVSNLDAALAEARRVLRPGGRFLCLDFSSVVLPLLENPHKVYLDRLLPRAARLFDVPGSDYLAESIRQFPDQATLAKAITRAGLGRVKHRNLLGGVAALHSAWRI